MQFFVSGLHPDADGPAPLQVVRNEQRGPHLVVCPPQIFTTARPTWQQRLGAFWLALTGQDHYDSVAVRPFPQLHYVRGEFLGALADVEDAMVDALRDRIARARSLRELWHLRAETFDIVSRHLGETEAQSRLGSLNAHFPMRVAQNSRPSAFGARTVSW